MRSDRWHAQALALCVVLAQHLALFRLLADSSTTRAAREQRAAPLTRIALRLIAARVPAATPAPIAVAPPARSHATPPTRSIASPSGKSALPRPPAATAIIEPQREAAARPDQAASADPTPPSLLDTEATRRAIRGSARAPSLGDRLARAHEEPDRVGAQGRLAEGVKAAGKGDCLKGEYAGAGMGLLSLPFFVIAEARGACAE
jgi:hypothetical protein